MQSSLREVKKPKDEKSEQIFEVSIFAKFVHFLLENERGYES